MKVALDLGCGLAPRNPFEADIVYGLDLEANHEMNVAGCDLAMDHLPFVSNHFDYITAYDLIEHIPRLIYLVDLERRYCFVELMNEIFRVLKPGGKFLSYTPAWPHGPAFRDPTHVNIITEETFPLYFGIGAGHDMARMYGFRGGFVIESQTWNAPWLVSALVKPPAK